MRMLTHLMCLAMLIVCAVPARCGADVEESPEEPDEQKSCPIQTCDLGAGVTLDMVSIPAGKFMRVDAGSRTPQWVKLPRGFLLGRSEVTQEQWRQVMGTNPSHFQPDKTWALMPVESVSWDDCQRFIEKLNALVKKTDPEMKDGLFRLPTEAEWEYACRAGTTTYWYNGSPTGGSAAALFRLLNPIAWNATNSKVNFDSGVNFRGAPNFSVNYPFSGPQPVRTKKPNAWGLYDMLGNVFEWCADWSGPYPLETTVVDPQGPDSGLDCVMRGGCWGRAPEYFIRADVREGAKPDFRSMNVGLRLARGGTVDALPPRTDASQRTWERLVAGSGPAGRKLRVGIDPRLTFDMVELPPGQFLMGRENQHTKNCKVGPGAYPHLVRLTKPCFMGIYPVTRGQWRAVMGADATATSLDDTLPVVNVSWDDAQAFIMRVNTLLARELPEKMQFRLPTAAEREYACRAGAPTFWPWGDNWVEMEAYGWIYSNNNGQLHPVGMMKPNRWGLYDMFGSTTDWCLDFYQERAYADGEIVVDPQGPPTGIAHAMYGNLNGGYEHYMTPVQIGGFGKSMLTGFRLALSLPIPALPEETAPTGSDAVKEDPLALDLGLTGTRQGHDVAYNPELPEEHVLLQMTALPAGTFVMGDAKGSADAPPHEVTLTHGFWLSASPITQAQWVYQMGRNPSHEQSSDTMHLPVDNVSWEDGKEFINRLNALVKRRYPHSTLAPFRLPSEAEWEYACRRQMKTTSITDNAGRNAETDAIEPDQPDQPAHSIPRKPRTTKKIQPDSVFAIPSTVAEWCDDWYGVYSAKALADPVGPMTGTERVIRGRMQGADVKGTAWNRTKARPDDHRLNVGFRVARTMLEPK